MTPTKHDSAATPAPQPRAGAAHESRSLRAGTMVWGLIITLVGLAAIAVATGRQMDLEIALITLFIVAGVALLAGSALSAGQRSARARRPGQ